MMVVRNVIWSKNQASVSLWLAEENQGIQLLISAKQLCKTSSLLSCDFAINRATYRIRSEVKQDSVVKLICPVYRLCHHNTSAWPQNLTGATVSDTIGHMTHTNVPQRSLRSPREPSSFADSLTQWDIWDVKRPQSVTVKAGKIYWNLCFQNI